MAPGGRRLKRESTVAYSGIITPDESVSASTGTFTPKTEEIEVALSDCTQDKFPGENFRSHDGLPSDLESGSFESATSEQQRRSAGVSIRTSRAPLERFPAAMDTEAGGLEIVGEKVRLLVDAIDELRNLGLKEIDTELPELVLVGDQSAGKSSLMSAIAEVNLPKGAGCCTKCPANIRTSPAETWSCKVSLHEYYNYIPGGRRPYTVTKNNPLPPWSEKIEEPKLTIRPFKTITEKSELENILRWAQTALLNPNTDYKAFIPGSGGIAERGPFSGPDEADFSPNLISLEISGPNLTALSFYDLPGIFQRAADDAGQYLVKVFENLARKYINHRNALIMCAITMQSDPGLSRSSAIIAMERAEKRCIGVLTMPDRLQDGQVSTDYDNILRGLAHKLPRGYFVTKQPSADFQSDIPDYHAQARYDEEYFFDNNQRWTNEWGDFRNRCGTVKIRKYLSQEMAKQINSSLPQIEFKIKEQMKLVDDKLSQLPPLPKENVQHIVRERLSSFSNEVKRLLEGGPSANRFLSSWAKLSHHFQRAIVEKMKPMFNYTDPADLKMQPPEVISLLDEDNDDVASTISTPSVRKCTDPATVPAARRPGSFNDIPVPFAFVRPESRPPSVKSEDNPSPMRRILVPQKPGVEDSPFKEFFGIGKNFMSIGGLRDSIMQYDLPGRPDHVDDAVQEDTCLQAVTPWSGPLDKFAQLTFKMLQDSIDEILLKYLGPYRQTVLYRNSRRHMHTFLKELADRQRASLQTLYDLETYKRFTINKQAFTAYRAEETKILWEARRKRRVAVYVEGQAQGTGKPLTDEQKADRAKKVTDEQLGEDPFHKEMQLAGYVRGYYKTAGLRFAENSTQAIQGMLFRRVHENIGYFLERKLELDVGNGEQNCQILMDENIEEADKRRALQSEKTKLDEAAARFQKLAMECREEHVDGAADVAMDDYDFVDQVGTNGTTPMYSHSTTPPNDDDME